MNNKPKTLLKNLLFVTLIIAVLSLFLPHPLILDAQQEQRPYLIQRLTDIKVYKDFVLGPGKVELNLAPGESTIVNLSVSNRTGIDKIFNLTTENFEGSQDLENAVVLLSDSKGPYSLKDYISVPAWEFKLSHGERATIPVTVSIPADEEPGGKYGSLVVGTVTRDPSGESGTAGTALVTRLGTLFFVTVPGQVSESGSLESFKTKVGKKIFTESPIDFEILFRNEGNVHLNPYGEIRIYNLLGKEVEMLKVDPWFTLPNSIRLREISWDKNQLFGFYTAHASINRGYEDIIDQEQFGFFVLPWQSISVFLVPIIILIVLFRFISRRFALKRKKY